MRRDHKILSKPVERCKECPFFSSNSEYPQTRCSLAGKTWGMGYYKKGDPVPKWCPLRQGAATIWLSESVK